MIKMNHIWINMVDAENGEYIRECMRGDVRQRYVDGVWRDEDAN